MIKKILPLALFIALVSTSCNKDVPEPVANTFPKHTGYSIGTLISDNASFSILKSALTRAGLLSALQDTSKQYTLFAPDNAAFIASGITQEVANVLPLEQLTPALLYHVVPQKVLSSQIPSTFPNLQYPSLLNPAPSVSALLRLTTFPTTVNGAWINNIPIKAANTEASNGVIHTVAGVVMPPSRYLWDRINTDSELTYLKAAIQRADSGVASNSLSNLEGLMKNIGANFTVFAPTDNAFKTLLTGAITQALMGQGMPQQQAYGTAQVLASTPQVFQNPALFPVLTAQTVKGIVVYHVMTKRAFTNNLPTTVANFPTVLNGVVANHPGLGLKATFGVPFVTAATVKGAANQTAANVVINMLPEPNGSSDQHYLNGVMHKIDQVLLPQ
ncbi:MAG: fasciclin domain-containing protein [bacterium]